MSTTDTMMQRITPGIKTVGIQFKNQNTAMTLYLNCLWLHGRAVEIEYEEQEGRIDEKGARMMEGRII